MAIVDGAEVQTLDRDQGRALLDRQARKLLNISADEFIAYWDAGKFDDDPERPEVMRLAMLLPFAR